MKLPTSTTSLPVSLQPAARDLRYTNKQPRAEHQYPQEPFPSDRTGLLAVLHPSFIGDLSSSLGERSADANWVDLSMRALEFAAYYDQPVFIVQTRRGWVLLLLGYGNNPHGCPWYDDHENGEYADDQYIGRVRT